MTQSLAEILSAVEVVDLTQPLHEDTPVIRIEPGLALTPYGTVVGDVVIRATEGFTPRLPGAGRGAAWRRGARF